MPILILDKIHRLFLIAITRYVLVENFFAV